MNRNRVSQALIDAGVNYFGLKLFAESILSMEIYRGNPLEGQIKIPITVKRTGQTANYIITVERERPDIRESE